MRKLHWVLWICGLWVGFEAGPAAACRYNVREVGFIDLGIEPYHLYGYVADDTPPETVSTFQKAAEVGLIDTNVQFELIHTPRDANHPALDYLRVHRLTDFPAAVLVSPEGQSMPIALAGPNASSAEGWASALDGILTSVKRAEILRLCAETYGVVLLIEGPDPGPNASAAQAARAAIERVAEQMERMPKPIARPPDLVTVAAAAAPEEAVLLWSLGVQAEAVTQPHAAVFYGRGRWIGPLMRGPQITEDNLANVLFVIGADCECGLDQRWVQGTMLAARWDIGLQATVAEDLGYDPESPVIRMEMISIVRRGMGGSAYPGVPFGYRELEVGGAPADSEAHDTVTTIPETVLAVAEDGGSVREPEIPVADHWPLGSLALGLTGLSACVVVVGMVILLRSRQV